MPDPNYAAFFARATAGKSPYGYQCRLACGEGADPENPDSLLKIAPCDSRLISIPTGLKGASR